MMTSRRYFLAGPTEALEPRTLMAVFTVTSTADGGPGTLRQAILDANATAGIPDQIHFAIPGPGVHTIHPTSPLPVITSPTTIDATTQPNYAGSPLIEIDGSAAGGTADGLVIGTDPVLALGSGSVIRGLAINRFAQNGVTVSANLVRVEGNVIGLNPAGDAARGNGGAGVYVAGGDIVTIGGTVARQRNVISGNAGPGVLFGRVGDARPDSLSIWGNYIGTDTTGEIGLGNGREGILGVEGGSVQIGSYAAGIGNVISANGWSGVRVVRSGDSTFIRRNMIGLNAAGTRGLGNGHTPGAIYRDGITAAQPAGLVIIGGSAADGEGNVIAANHGSGVSALDPATSVFVRGNVIGTDLAGSADLGNAGDGITLKSVMPQSGYEVTGNVISGNGGDGLHAEGIWYGTVGGNYVGVDRTGTRPVGNDGDGVDVSGSGPVDIGYETPGRPRNVISANRGHGIRLSSGWGNTSVENNIIGADVTGEVPLGNGGSGIFLTGDGHQIGRYEFAQGGNLICANGGDGITADGTGLAATSGGISGNRIGVSLSGNAPGMGNGRHGVALLGMAYYRIAGQNVISRNAGSGVLVAGGAASVSDSAIFANGGLEIDLGGDGVTPNDPLDADQLTNYPAITHVGGVPATHLPARTVVQYTLSAEPRRTYVVEFFAVDDPDDSGHGGSSRSLGTTAVTTDAAGNATAIASVRQVAPGTDVTATSTDGNYTSEFALNVRAVQSEVAGRFVFYNNSPRDGGDRAANPADDAAIDTTRYPLPAAGRATRDNFTTYHRGINGVMIDLPALPGGATVSADDFEFRSGNGSATGWRSGPAPSSITVRRGAGVGGTDRVTLIWPDYNPDDPDNPANAVANRWLQVTVKATGDTGLSRPDTFYFGNLVGDSGRTFSRSRQRVASGELKYLLWAIGTTSPALIGWYDHNGDGRVTAVDFAIARRNLLRTLSIDVAAPIA